MTVGLEQDFDAFYSMTHRRMVGQIYAMTGSLHEAEDCVQEAYARAWQQWGRLSQAGSPEAWVRTVAGRLAISSWRKAVNRLKAHRREQQRAEEVAGMGPDHVAVVAALRRISPDQRMAIVLFHYAGLTIEEISVETGAATGTVKARLSRGRRALAPHLAEFADSLELPRQARTQKFTARQPQPSGRGI